MASLFRAIGNMFRQKRDEAAKALADPVRDGKFAIEDSKKQIRGHTTQVAKLRAETIKMKAEHKDASAEKKKYENIAKRAGEAGNEDDVRSAVEAIQKWQSKASELKGQIAQNEQVEANLRKQLDAARTKVARAEQNHARLASRQRGAEIRKSLAQASQEFSEGQGGLASLDDLEDAVRQNEAEAQAFEEMAAPAVEADLAEKYDGSDSDTNDMVAKFMKTGK